MREEYFSRFSLNPRLINTLGADKLRETYACSGRDFDYEQRQRSKQFIASVIKEHNRGFRNKAISLAVSERNRWGFDKVWKPRPHYFN